MHFDLIQSLSLAGNPTVANDDRAGASARLAWVIDGATDLGPPGLVGAQGGAAWLASEAHAAFTAAADAPIDAVLASVGDQLTNAFDRACTRAAKGRWELPLASVLAARVTMDGLECAWLGDCVGLLQSGGGVTRIGPEADDRAAEAARAASLAHHGLGNVRRSAPILKNLRATRGRPEMRVLSVDPVHRTDPGTLRLVCEPGDTLLLMTDGFAALIDSYDLYDAAGLMAALDTRGLAELAAELRRFEREDAACTRHPRFKTSDDATALLLRIGA